MFPFNKHHSVHLHPHTDVHKLQQIQTNVRLELRNKERQIFRLM